MEELQLTLTPSRVDQRNFGVMLSNWRVGQVLNALVVDRMPSGNVLLNVGGREFVTPLDLPVQAGNRLQLEVQQVQPQMTLKLLANLSEAASSQLTQKNAPTFTSNHLGSHSGAKPASVAALLSTLSAQPGLRALVAQTPILSALVTALSAHSLQANALSSSALSAAIDRSGLFNEANLTAGRSERARDSSKSQLVQLQKAIGDLPAATLNLETRASLNALSDLTNAAIANLTQQQLISMPQEGGAQRWFFEIPLALGLNFVDLKITIERDEKAQGGEDDKATWRVDLSLDLPEAGPMRVLLTMADRDVSVVLSSDSPSVRSMVDSSFGQLKTRMIVSDFRVKSLVTQAMTDTSDSSGLSEPSASSSTFEVRA
jgi:hypothetical protein